MSKLQALADKCLAYTAEAKMAAEVCKRMGKEPYLALSTGAALHFKNQLDAQIVEVVAGAVELKVDLTSVRLPPPVALPAHNAPTPASFELLALAVAGYNASVDELECIYTETSPL
ncbi:Hypothetical protein POVN_LOCUS229 [uncultured virus]|nr:Hypothetical protein POVN_LOCUS229 [uncultured virus]